MLLHYPWFNCLAHEAEIDCVAAVSFPFPGGVRTREQKRGRANEHAWNELNIGEKWGGGREKRRFLRSPHPLPLLLIFRTPSQFRSLRVSFWKRLLRRLSRDKLLPPLLPSIVTTETVTVRETGDYGFLYRA